MNTVFFELGVSDFDCTGTCMGDYLRASNLAHFSDEVIGRCDILRTTEQKLPPLLAHN